MHHLHFTIFTPILKSSMMPLSIFTSTHMISTLHPRFHPLKLMNSHSRFSKNLYFFDFDWFFMNFILSFSNHIYVHRKILYQMTESTTVHYRTWKPGYWLKGLLETFSSLALARHPGNQNFVGNSSAPNLPPLQNSCFPTTKIKPRRNCLDEEEGEEMTEAATRRRRPIVNWHLTRAVSHLHFSDSDGSPLKKVRVLRLRSRGEEGGGIV